MKGIILFSALLAVAMSFETIDLSKIRPLEEIPEFRAMYPNKVFSGKVGGVNVAEANSRIINGQIAGPTTVPYMVGLMLSFDTASGFCGGILVSSTYILTSGVCVAGVPAITALLGASDMTRIGEIIPVVETKLHPQFNADSQANDIALLRLMRAARLTDEVQIARLPMRRQQSQLFVDESARVSGFGTTATNSNIVPVNELRFVRLPVITNLTCLLRFPAYITGNNVCVNTGPSTPCTGDEGGPLSIVEADGIDTIIGVKSYTFSLSCTLGWPAVFMRITSYYDFIENNSNVVINP